MGRTEDGSEFALEAEHVVIATGHTVEDDAAPGGTYFDSPYPTSRLESIPAGKVAVLGTSLSAIDTVMTVAMCHGTFDDRNDTLRYVRKPFEALRLTMMSRSGILPEADFFCPIPYLPLSIFTEDAVAALIEAGSAGLLDRTMALFAQELVQADPAYASAVSSVLDDADTFPPAYFAPREEADAFDWARSNLAEVMANRDAERVVEWRYAILRMHETFEAVVEHLDAADRKRFDAGMKKVFVDNYAAIPPLSVERLIAVHEAGVLDILKLGDDYEIEEVGGGHRLMSGGVSRTYDVLVDATGTDGVEPEPAVPEPGGCSRREIRRRTSGDPSRRASLHAEKRPFIQGLVSCEEVGTEVASAIVEAVASAPQAIDQAA